MELEDAADSTCGFHWEHGSIRLLDQTLLPGEIRYRNLTSWEEVVEAIQSMKVRGAPALGVLGAFGLVLAANQFQDWGQDGFRRCLTNAAETISRARPTAVNLAWAVNRSMSNIREMNDPLAIRQTLLKEAIAIRDEDLRANVAIGNLGAELLPSNSTILTHCNTGSLATAGYGTALGIIKTAWRDGKLTEVIATETRPLFQGARLTAWELVQSGIPVSVIVDGAAGGLLQSKRVTAVIVGADRIAANGDVVNKIGTYPIAVVARRHRVPFYVAAPTSTIDLNSARGSTIIIEERPAKELILQEREIIPRGVNVSNPAFDCTPGSLVSGIITEVGVAYPPYRKSLKEIMQG